MNGAAMGAREWAMLVLLSAIWGGSFFFNAVTVAEIPVLTVVTLRVGIAAIALLLWLRVSGRPMPLAPDLLGAFVVMGLLNNVIPFSLIVWGQSQIASGLAAIMNAATPLLTAVVAHFALSDERLTAARLGGVALGLAGVAFMMGADAMAGIGAALPAQLAILGASLAYALAAVFGRRFKRMGAGPLQVAAGQVTASTLMLAPLALMIDRPWAIEAPSAGAVGAILGLALLSTAFAYILYFRILAAAGATNLALVTQLVPVSAIVLGVLFLGETLAARHVLGMAAIALGFALIDGRVLRLFGKRD